MGFLSTFISAMFSGKSMKAPPGFSVCATLKALRTISGVISGLEHLGAVLGDRPEHVHEIEDLVAFLVQARGRALARDGDDRRAVHVGVGDAGDEVGGAGAERGHANARAAGEAPVDVGHEGRALLVVAGDELDRAATSSASITSMFSSPGMPKMYWTPSFSRHLTSSSAADCCLAAGLALDLVAGFCLGRCGRGHGFS